MLWFRRISRLCSTLASARRKRLLVYFLIGPWALGQQQQQQRPRVPSVHTIRDLSFFLVASLAPFFFLSLDGSYYKRHCNSRPPRACMVCRAHIFASCSFVYPHHRFHRARAHRVLVFDLSFHGSSNDLGEDKGGATAP